MTAAFFRSVTFVALLVLSVAWTPHVHAIAGIGPTLITQPAAHAATSPPVPGYTIWLDGAFSGNSNSIWIDRSGNGNSATLQGGQTAPTLTAGAINGLPAYSFDGVLNSLATPAVTIPADLTVYVVFQSISAISNSDGLIDAHYDTGFFIRYNNGAPGQGWYEGTEGSALPGPINTVTHVFVMNRSSVTNLMTTYMDGTLVSTNSTSPATGFNIRTLAYAPYSQGAAHMNTWMCEYIEYAISFTTLQMTNTNAYVNAKWF